MPAAWDERAAAHRRTARRQHRAPRFVPAAPPDGRGGGRTAYAIRLVDGGDLGVAGTLVGTSALLEAHLVNESIHLGSTVYGRRWWGTRVDPEVKLLLLGHWFDDCRYGR